MSERRYGYEDGVKASPPNFARIINSMNDTELAEEIEHSRGDDNYQAALRQAAERRGVTIK